MADVGVATLFAVGEADPIVGGATTGALLDIQNESVRETTAFVDANGMKGVRGRNIARIREGPKIIAGGFSLHPSTFDLSYLLPKCYGAAASGTNYPLGETLSSFYVQKKLGGTGNRVHTYAGCVVSSMRISSSFGQPIMIELDVIGLTQTPGSTAPTVTLNTSTTVLQHSDMGTFTIGGVSYENYDYAITINNFVEARQVNSRTATALYATDRVVAVECTVPEGDLLFATIGDNNLAVIATWTNSAQSLTLNCGSVRFTNQTPTISDRGEIRYALAGQAFKSGSTDEVVTTLDSTP